MIMSKRVRNIVCAEIGYAALAEVLYGGKPVEEFVAKTTKYRLVNSRMLSVYDDDPSDPDIHTWSEMCEEAKHTGSCYPAKAHFMEINSAWPQAKQRLEGLGFKTHNPFR